VTTFESLKVARPWECPPRFVERIGTQTHRRTSPFNEVVRQSFIHPRAARSVATAGLAGGGRVGGIAPLLCRLFSF